LESSELEREHSESDRQTEGHEEEIERVCRGEDDLEREKESHHSEEVECLDSAKQESERRKDNERDLLNNESDEDEEYSDNSEGDSQEKQLCTSDATEQEYDMHSLRWRKETQAEQESFESASIPLLQEEVEANQFCKKIYQTPWIVLVDAKLTELIERHIGQVGREKMMWVRGPIDLYWRDGKTFPRIGLVGVDDYAFWHNLALENPRMKLVGSIAASLVSCPSSEAQCERGFSFLHDILRRERNRLSLPKLYESMKIKTL
jgi:hypothetical protein